MLVHTRVFSGARASGTPIHPRPRWAKLEAHCWLVTDGTSNFECWRSTIVAVDELDFPEPTPEGGWRKVDDVWWVACPNRVWTKLHSEHEVTEHEDGTITVSPSIFFNRGYDQVWKGSGPIPEPLKPWHGYLERGVFREV